MPIWGCRGKRKAMVRAMTFQKNIFNFRLQLRQVLLYIISRRIIFNRFSVDAISVCSFHPDIHMNGNSIISYICCIFLFYNVKIPDNSYAYVFLHWRPQRMQFHFIHLTIIFHCRFYLHRDFFILYRCLV